MTTHKFSYNKGSETWECSCGWVFEPEGAKTGRNWARSAHEEHAVRETAEGNGETFIVRTQPTGTVHINPTIEATFPEINRPAKRQPLRGLATLVEGTGRYRKDIVNVRANDNLYPTIRTRQDDVKHAIRRLRQEEAQDIMAAEQAIRDARATLEAAHQRKAEVLKRAFQRGHTVYLNEVVGAARAKLEARR